MVSKIVTATRGSASMSIRVNQERVELTERDRLWRTQICDMEERPLPDSSRERETENPTPLNGVGFFYSLSLLPAIISADFQRPPHPSSSSGMKIGRASCRERVWSAWVAVV